MSKTAAERREFVNEILQKAFDEALSYTVENGMNMDLLLVASDTDCDEDVVFTNCAPEIAAGLCLDLSENFAEVLITPADTRTLN